MFTRLFYGTVQAGKEAEAIELLSGFVDRAKALPGLPAGSAATNWQ